MLFATLLMNDLPLIITPFTIFLICSTFLLYNFHRISFKLNYSSSHTLFESIRIVRFKPFEKLIYILAFTGTFISFFYLKPVIYFYLIPLAVISISYSMPLIRKGNKKLRLLEFYSVKTPVLALVWALTTTIIPLVEQNISISAAFVWIQVLSRSLFIFSLCIPFEIRDMEADRKNNVRTLPVLYGKKVTKVIGIIAVVIELITHHFMFSISLPLIVALDLSSIVALILIILQGSKNPYYYKLFVDGVMMLRFLFLYAAVQLT
jgi:4-hydroxybenzoate polyprenyltransferase